MAYIIKGKDGIKGPYPCHKGEFCGNDMPAVRRAVNRDKHLYENLRDGNPRLVARH